MQKALVLVIVIGTAIGLVWPTGERAAPVRDGGQDGGAAAAPGAAEHAAAVPAAPAGPRETVLERSLGGHFYANVEINGQLVRFLVDTGASTVALAEKDAARIGIPFSRSEFEVVGEGASGPVRGKRITLDRVTLDGKEVRDVRGAILEGGDMSLLGQTYLGQFAVEMRGDTMRIH